MTAFPRRNRCKGSERRVPQPSQGVQFPPSDAEAESARQATAQTSWTPTPPALLFELLSRALLLHRSRTDWTTAQRIGCGDNERDGAVRPTEADPLSCGSENHEDTELLRKPYTMGQETQNRMVDLLTVVENADVTVELI